MPILSIQLTTSRNSILTRLILTLSTCDDHAYTYGHTYSKSMDQPGKVASPARGQLNRKMNISLSAFVPENLVVHIHTIDSSKKR